MPEVLTLPLLTHLVFPILMKTNPMAKPILTAKEQALSRSRNRVAANASTAMLATILVITLYKVFFLASIPYV